MLEREFYDIIHDTEKLLIEVMVLSVAQLIDDSKAADIMMYLGQIMVEKAAECGAEPKMLDPSRSFNEHIEKICNQLNVTLD